MHRLPLALRIVGHLIGKEFRHFFRDPQMVRMIVVVPVVQLLLLGYAITVDVRNLSLQAVDFDRSPESRALIESFRHHRTFTFEGLLPGRRAMHEALDSGRATAVLLIPSGFARRLGRMEPAQVGMLMDGVDSNASQIAWGHARGIVESYALERLKAARAGQPLPEPRPRSVVLYNPDLESRPYMVPGVMVTLLTMLTTVLTGMGLVRERETGTLEQLSVTPIRSWQLMVGKTLPFVVITLVVLAICLAVMLLWFGVPMRGSWWLLAGFSLLFLLNSLGLGLFISAISRSRQQAFFMAWFTSVFAIIMSGFFFPIGNMPPLLQHLTYLNPMRYYLAVVRELFLKGSGPGAFEVELTGLLVLGPLALLLAGLRFSKRAR
jgi:ABC-2 type transport system permease protein